MFRRFGMRNWAAAAAALMFFCGCATTPEPAAVPELPAAETERTTTWTASEIENALGGRDPIEGFNRSMFAVNAFLMDYVADPLGRVYTSIFPRPVIEAIHNACLNLEFPGRAVSCLLSAEWEGAGDETLRFFINTTLGCAGLFDVAGGWGFHSTEANFGKAFASWGIGPGCTFMLPLCSSINVRDTVGSLFDMAFDGKTYIPYAGWATALNRMVMAHRDFSRVADGSSDRYKTFREMALLNRELQLRMWRYQTANALFRAARTRKAAAAAAPGTHLAPEPEPVPALPGLQGRWVPIPGYRSRGPVQDSLRVVRFTAQNNDDFWYMRLSVFNRDFSGKCEERDLEMVESAPKLRYGFWTAPESDSGQPRPERLALLMPGIGGNYFGFTATALAELLNRHGMAVAAIDSAFAWQFAAAFGNRQLPGHLPDDAEQIRQVLKRVVGDLKDAGRIQAPEITLIGYSFGGLHTLKIAELEAAGPELGISRYVAINPPVDLRHAVETADRLGAAGRRWSMAETIDRTVEVAGKQLLAFSRPPEVYYPNIADPTEYGIEVDDAEAECFAGLYLKTALRSLLFTAERDRGLGFEHRYSWGDRNALYLEIDRVSATEYATRFVAAEHPELTVDEIYRRSNLRSFAPALRGRPEVKVLHNIDDFLLTRADRDFLDGEFGDRLTWFSNGGHLGNLYTAPVQEAIVAAATGEAQR